MTPGSYNVSYNPQQPPLLLLSLAQLQGLDAKRLAFHPKEDTKGEGLVMLQQPGGGDGERCILPEFEAAKRIAFSTPLGQTVRK